MDNKPTFTPEQIDAIEQSGQNILVSAGAGSGKTTVLSQRVLKHIMTDRISVNDMLIVTFTVAAAASMKEKIYKVVQDAYYETNQEYLWREAVRINSAEICTIDSFQAKFLREFFNLAGVSPDFTTLDDTERGAMEADILDDILERRYSKPTEEFMQMLELFGGEGENEGLKDAINELYDYLRAVPFRDKWLDDKLSAYDSAETWVDSVCSEMLPGLQDAADAFRAGCMSMSESKQLPALQAESESAERMLEACRAKDIELMGDIARRYLASRGRITFSSKEPVQQRCRRFRSLFKDICEMSLFDPRVCRNIASDLKRLRGGISALFDVEKEYGALIRAKCAELNRYSFDEISSLTLELAVKNYNPSDGSFEPTELALQVRDRFKEIMIDEYQDINDRQDLFFRAISNDNLFIVGDVKQSIYGFRRANPDNFIRKRSSFLTIDLNANFRSRSGILDFANFIFEKLFTADTCGINYDQGQRLIYGGSYPPASDGSADAEIMIVPVANERITEDCRRKQAECIAGRIKELVASGYRVREGDASRAVSYGDIAVLSRIGKGVFEIYEQEFKRAGIPVYSQGKSSMFDSPDVNLMLDLLSVICNPYDDTPLFIVLNSQLYGFSAEQIAQVRINDRRARLYSSVKRAAERDEKFAAFTRDLEYLRLMAAGVPVHRLLWHIYVRRDYLSYAEASADGAQRRENLLDLYLFAKKYAEGSGGSIPEFLDFVRRTRADNGRTDKSAADSGDHVRLMTIHSSKGLEFPICFVTGLSEQGSNRFGSIVTDDRLGVGARIRSESMSTQRTTFVREAILLRKRRLDAAENIRLLYVAMTRAKEKLILCSSMGTKRLQTIDQYRYSVSEDGRVSPFCVQTYSKLSDFVFQGLIFHPAARQCVCSSGHSDLFAYRFCNSDAPPVRQEQTDDARPQLLGLEKDELDRRFSYRYPYATAHIPAKLSVTEINKNLADELSEKVAPLEETRIEPLFISGPKPDALRYGTLLHKFCQYADLSRPAEEQLRRLREDGVFSQQEADAVNIADLEKFRSSRLFGEVVKKCVRLHREEHFVVRIPAAVYDAAASEEEYILMQGAMDMVCEFEDHVAVVDFKSGSDERRLLQTYSAQLQCYAYAAQRLYGKPVRGLYIWSFGAGKCLAVEPSDLTKNAVNDRI